MNLTAVLWWIFRSGGADGSNWPIVGKFREWITLYASRKLCSSNWIRFYRVLFSYSWFPSRFTGFCFVLLGFTGFYWVLLGFTWFYLVLLGFTWFYQVLLGFTRFYQVLLGYTRLYLVLLGFTGFYWVLIWLYRVMPKRCQRHRRDVISWFQRVVLGNRRISSADSSSANVMETVIKKMKTTRTRTRS